jgi:hypothetical protein
MAQPNLFDAEEHLASLSGAAMSPVEGEPAEQGAPEESTSVAGEEPPAEPEGEGEVEETPESVPYEQYAEEHRAAEGRKHEIDTLRQRVKEYKDTQRALEDNQVELRGMIDQLRQPVEPEYNPEIFEDAAVRYFHDRTEQINQRLDQMTGQQTEQTQLQQQAVAVRNYATQARESYKEVAPDWDDAYQYVREQYGKLNLRGLEGEALESRLNLQEQALIIQCMQDGTDPAHEVYEMARAIGFRGEDGSVREAVPASELQAEPPASSRRVRRIRKGVEQISPSSMRGSSGTGHGRLSIEQVNALPERQRLAILGDVDKLQQLDSTGYVTLD